MVRAWVIVVGLVAGCVRSDNTECADGRTECPVGTECASITLSDSAVVTTCVQHDQRVSCAMLDDGNGCLIQQMVGTCHDGVCFEDQCGNWLLDSTEVCDDGNAVAGDGCSATCGSNETCGNREIDVVTRESCDGGDAMSNDGCSSRCATESPTWQRFDNARPEARSYAGLVYDVARRRVVMVGGRAGFTQFGDTSEWDGSRWSQSFALPEPLPRSGHGMAYVAARGQIVMFGGDSAREMWLRDREGTWSLSTPPVRPPIVSGATMVYDAGRRRVVMFGGFTSSQYSNATWIWDGTTWRELTTQPRPSARVAQATPSAEWSCSPEARTRRDWRATTCGSSTGTPGSSARCPQSVRRHGTGHR